MSDVWTEAKTCIVSDWNLPPIFSGGLFSRVSWYRPNDLREPLLATRRKLVPATFITSGPSQRSSTVGEQPNVFSVQLQRKSGLKHTRRFKPKNAGKSQLIHARHCSQRGLVDALFDLVKNGRLWDHKKTHQIDHLHYISSSLCSRLHLSTT